MEKKQTKLQEQQKGRSRDRGQIKTKQETAKPSKTVDASTQGTMNQIQIHSVFGLKASCNGKHLQSPY